MGAYFYTFSYSFFNADNFPRTGYLRVVGAGPTKIGWARRTSGSRPDLWGPARLWASTGPTSREGRSGLWVGIPARSLGKERPDFWVGTGPASGQVPARPPWKAGPTSEWSIVRFRGWNRSLVSWLTPVCEGVKVW